MGMFSGSWNPTVITKKFYLYYLENQGQTSFCMTFRISSVNMIRSTVDLGIDSNIFEDKDIKKLYIYIYIYIIYIYIYIYIYI